MEFVWDLNEEEWKNYGVDIRKVAESEPDGAVNTAGVVGCCRVGDLCFDLRAWGCITEDEVPSLGFELYVGGVDTGYNETSEGRPYDIVDEYGEFPIAALDMPLMKFKELAEETFEKADLIAKANEPLHIW